VTDRKKMEGYCSTGQSPQWAVVPVEEEEESFYHSFNPTFSELLTVSLHKHFFFQCDRLNLASISYKAKYLCHQFLSIFPNI
jgi:hypothetical protein